MKSQKKLKFPILMVSWREVILIFSQYELHEKIERWWKFSIFGRNSRILKVLAHEISDEIPKKLKFSILMVLSRDGIIIFSQYELHEKKLSGGGSFHFLSKFSNFRGVSLRNKWWNPKKIKNLESNGMMKRGNSYFLSAWTSWKKLSGGGCFQFFVEILEFQRC